MTGDRALSRDESFAYELARCWRKPNYAPDLTGMDWAALARLLRRNRMSVMASLVFQRAGASAGIPLPASDAVTEQVETYQKAAGRYGGALTAFLNAAGEQRLDAIVLKGLWLCEKIYGDAAMRPGGDIDILVRRGQVQAALRLLEKQGIGAYWPNLLHDEYFTRHHLHQQRSTPDLGVWFEIHWALDHPYTLLTVDYEGIFERTSAGRLLGAPLREMSPPDLILSLAIHLVKHAVYLPSLLKQPDLPRVILADGMLMYYLDIHEVIKHYDGQLDWDVTVQLARAWGAVDILGSVLRVCRDQLQTPIPDSVLAALPVEGPWPITRRLMARAAQQELAAYEGRPENRFWKLVLSSNGAFILRPVRLLETASYFLPPVDFMRRRYGRSDLLTRLRHFSRALLQSLRFAWDTLYFGVERYSRLKRLGKSASLFNTLDTDL